MSPRRRKAEATGDIRFGAPRTARTSSPLSGLRADTDARALARMIEVTLGGSYLVWTLYRPGPAAKYLRKDLDATLRPYLMRGVERARS